MTAVRSFLVTVGIVVLGSGMGTGCDAVAPVQRGKGNAPQVSDVSLTPDTVTVPTSENTVEVSFSVSAQVSDSDGTVERTVVIVESASSPFRQTTGLSPGRLESGAPLSFSQPVRREVYSVRVFAVDNDSLTSNQGIGQLQLIP